MRVQTLRPYARQRALGAKDCSLTSNRSGQVEAFSQATAVRVTQVHLADIQTSGLEQVTRPRPYLPQSRRKLFAPTYRAGPRYDRGPPSLRTRPNSRRTRLRSPAACLPARIWGAGPARRSRFRLRAPAASEAPVAAPEQVPTHAKQGLRRRMSIESSAIAASPR